MMNEPEDVPGWVSVTLAAFCALFLLLLIGDGLWQIVVGLWCR
jgi:hypothetical protein